MGVTLYDYQEDAIRRMKTGCILCGGVGSGKSITSIAYYFTKYGGNLKPFKKMTHPKALYIITTARKRDTKEWEKDLYHFLLGPDDDEVKVVIDSWNNIEKYAKVTNAFFIFDEQRLVSYGKWTKSFLKIVRAGNDWVLLSATPGDTWTDYMPVFIGNGFYKNKTEFMDNHVIMSYHCNFPKIEKYVGIKRLERLRDNILVNMNFCRETQSHHIDIFVEYDRVKYKVLFRNRWNEEKGCPIETASELCYELRKITNTHQERLDKIVELVRRKCRVIIFYNFVYEKELLLNLDYGDDFEIAEWSGQKHQDIPSGNHWVYLVQYTAGAEGWNCVKTDTIIFFSQNYSYKIMTQAAGRIDRLNTPFKDLYFYHIKSYSPIDLGIARALSSKKKFNEKIFIEKTNSGH